MNTKAIAVAVVIIIIIAAVGVYALTSDDDDDKDKNYSTLDVSTSLAVYGNANEDALINDYDVDILNDIINGKKSMSDYPLADANQDGKITQEDVDIVKKLMNHESCEVNIICLDNNNKQTTMKVNYPLNNIVVYSTNMKATVLYVNGAEHVAGFFKVNYPNLEAPLVEASTNLGDSLEAGWSNFTALDAKLASEGGVQAFMTTNSTSSMVLEQKYIDDLNDANIPLLIFATTDVKDEISVSLLLGFLFGEDNELISQKYAETSWQVLNKIESLTGNLSDSQKATAISITMGMYVAKNSSENYDTIREAGGLPYFEVNSDFKNAFNVNKSTRITTGETLINYDDAKYIISIRSIDSKSSDLNSTIVSTWDKYYTYFNDLDDYQSMFYVNNLLPGAIKLAYLCEYMYPSLVDSGYADSVFAAIAEVSSYLTGCTTENTATAFSYADYKAAGGTH